MSTPIVVMGVQGTGKTTVGQALARRLGAEFLDGDDLHPEANRQKMAAGRPLDDDDRAPWLALIAEAIREHGRSGRTLIVGCSALKREYRDRLRTGDPGLRFLHLDGERALLVERIAGRSHAYMPPALLDSQLATLEPLEADESGLVVDIALSVEEIVERAASALA